jgi:NAD(P)-dependent dehydrogenase (short-subunit alcohol dehydrogenase family)
LVLTTRLDGLVLNAAEVRTRRELTPDGFETNFATNYLSGFLLTNLLLPLLTDSAPARIVTLSSSNHAHIKHLGLDTLPAGTDFNHMRTYSTTKLLAVLFVSELARRLHGTGVTVNAADPAARAVAAAGLGMRLPYQLPVILSVMRAARHAGYAGPVANLSFPEVTGPIQRRLSLAPALGLGNAGMILRRVRAALHAAEPEADLPLIRVLAHHSQVYASMQAQQPADPEARCRIYLGEDGRRDDELAFRAPALPPGLRYNAVTAAAALPVLQALLPGSASLRWSTPAPGGLPGGYPVVIANGAVTLDLPPGLTEQDAIAFNDSMACRDGIEKIDDDGTVHFTAASREAVAGVGYGIAWPLSIDDLRERATALDAALGET